MINKIKTDLEEKEQKEEKSEKAAGSLNESKVDNTTIRGAKNIDLGHGL